MQKITTAKLKMRLESTAGQVLFYEDGSGVTPFFNLSNGYQDTERGSWKEGDPLSEDCEYPEDVNAEDEIQTVCIGRKRYRTMDVGSGNRF